MRRGHIRVTSGSCLQGVLVFEKCFGFIRKYSIFFAEAAAVGIYTSSTSSSSSYHHHHNNNSNSSSTAAHQQEQTSSSSSSSSRQQAANKQQKSSKKTAAAAAAAATTTTTTTRIAAARCFFSGVTIMSQSPLPCAIGAEGSAVEHVSGSKWLQSRSKDACMDDSRKFKQQGALAHRCFKPPKEIQGLSHIR